MSSPEIVPEIVPVFVNDVEYQTRDSMYDFVTVDGGKAPTAVMDNFYAASLAPFENIVRLTETDETLLRAQIENGGYREEIVTALYGGNLGPYSLGQVTINKTTIQEQYGPNDQSEFDNGVGVTPGILSEFFINGIVEQGGEGENHYLSKEMAHALNLLLATLKQVGLILDKDNRIPINTDLTDKIIAWKKLISNSGTIQEILRTAVLATPYNRSMQSLIELIYIRTGNELLVDTLDTLETAIQTTEESLTALEEAQNLHNVLTVQEKDWHIEQLAYAEGGTFADSPAYREAALNVEDGDPAKIQEYLVENLITQIDPELGDVAGSGEKSAAIRTAMEIINNDLRTALSEITIDGVSFISGVDGANLGKVDKVGISTEALKTYIQTVETTDNYLIAEKNKVTTLLHEIAQMTPDKIESISGGWSAETKDWWSANMSGIDKNNVPSVNLRNAATKLDQEIETFNTLLNQKNQELINGSETIVGIKSVLETFGLTEGEIASILSELDTGLDENGEWAFPESGTYTVPAYRDILKVVIENYNEKVIGDYWEFLHKTDPDDTTRTVVERINAEIFAANQQVKNDIVNEAKTNLLELGYSGISYILDSEMDDEAITTMTDTYLPLLYNENRPTHLQTPPDLTAPPNPFDADEEVLAIWGNTPLAIAKDRNGVSVVPPEYTRHVGPLLGGGNGSSLLLLSGFGTLFDYQTTLKQDNWRHWTDALMNEPLSSFNYKVMRDEFFNKIQDFGDGYKLRTGLGRTLGNIDLGEDHEEWIDESGYFHKALYDAFDDFVETILFAQLGVDNMEDFENHPESGALWTKWFFEFSVTIWGRSFNDMEETLWVPLPDGETHTFEVGANLDGNPYDVPAIKYEGKAGFAFFFDDFIQNVGGSGPAFSFLSDRGFNHPVAAGDWLNDFEITPATGNYVWEDFNLDLTAPLLAQYATPWQTTKPALFNNQVAPLTRPSSFEIGLTDKGKATLLAVEFYVPLKDKIAALIEKYQEEPAFFDEDGIVITNSILGKLLEVQRDFTKARNEALSGLQISFGDVDTDEFWTWLLDSYSAQEGVTADSSIGGIQRNITSAISAGQSLNDRQKEEVRRYLFVFEEYYKSAAAILSKITQIIEKMAQGIGR